MCCIPCCNTNYDFMTKIVIVYKFSMDKNEKNSLDQRNATAKFVSVYKNNDLQNHFRFFTTYLIGFISNTSIGKSIL